MTAEVAVMNKQAVALAADSAVTFQHPTGQKIFPSASKIFALSQYNPVGIMIYGDASIMGVPWETVIKAYKNQLKHTVYETISDYANNFISFLKEDQLFLSEQAENFHVKHFIDSYCNLIKLDISNENYQALQTKLTEGGAIEPKALMQEATELVPGIIQNHFERWENAPVVSGTPENFLNILSEKYNELIREKLNGHFPNIPEPSMEQLMSVVRNYFAKYPDGFTYTETSGIVIAGFGANDVFPVVESYSIDGKVCGFLKHKRNESESDRISLENDASVLPFAQKDMVNIFMTGIATDIGKAIDGNLQALINSFPEFLVKRLEKKAHNIPPQLQELAREILQEMGDQFINEIDSIRREDYVFPVLQVVQMLPKDDLATMAESFVNLTSFKRRISMDSETVGGPIDVAVISKGDGFIWIKHKQYFERTLNEQFYANYYKEARNVKEVVETKTQKTNHIQ